MKELLYPYHVQRVQALIKNDFRHHFLQTPYRICWKTLQVHAQMFFMHNGTNQPTFWKGG